MESVRVSSAIIVRDGKVLCAHRSSDGIESGWEFPGCRVDAEDAPEQALRRRVLEGLGARLSTMWLLDTVEHDDPNHRLVMDCFVCALVPGEEIQPVEHDEIGWLDRDGLLEVDWLPASKPIASLLGTFWDQILSSTHL